MKKIILSLVVLLSTITSHAQFPVSEGFEGTFPPSGWAVHNIHGPNITWALNDAGNSLQPPFEGTHAAYLQRENVASGTTEDWLVTPLIDLSQYQDPELIFYSRLTIAGNQYNTYSILVSSVSQTNISNFGQIKQWTEMEINPSQQEYNEVKINLLDLITNSNDTNLTGIDANSSIYIAFVMKGDFGDRWLIDNVKVRSKCSPPETLLANNITDFSAELSWGGSGSNNWELEIVNASDAPIGSGITVNQNTYTATATTAGNSFEEGMTYEYYVRSICGAGTTENESTWTGPYNFKILKKGEVCEVPIIVPPTLPYINTNGFYYGSEVYSGSAGAGCGEGANNILSYYTIYSYTPVSSTQINVSLNPLKNASGIFIYAECSNIGISCLAAASSLNPLTKNITNFAVSGGNTYYIVVATSEPANNNYTLILSENTCLSSIEATFNINTDCLSSISSFDAVVNVQDLGGATSVIATAFSNGIASTSQIISAPGSYSFSSFLPGENAYILLQNQQNQNCLLLSHPLSKDMCPPLNDECINATTLNVDTTGSGISIQGTLSGATASIQNSSCVGVLDDDVWYKFVAVNSKHHINISNINGLDTDINYAIYEGSDCSTLNQIYCGGDNAEMINNLIVGQTYYIRLYSAGDIATQTTFNLSNTAYTPNCTDSNSQSGVVKALFVELLNHLIDVHQEIINLQIQEPDQGYFCPELASLTPYIIDENPKIYNFELDSSGLSFSFNDHGDGISNADVYIPLYELQYVTDINFFSYTSPSVTANVHISFVDGASISKRVHISHVDFCPDDPCNPVAGNIALSNGLDCIVSGSVCGFNLITDNSEADIQYWVVYKLDENSMVETLEHTSHNSSPSFLYSAEGSYLVKVVVLTPDGCSTTIQKIFEVQAVCDQCTETDNQSQVIKQKYINLVNYLLANHENLVNQAPFTSPELAALAPFITDPNPLIYNLNYLNGVLSFSFSDHGGTNDISIQDNGPINDISLLNFTSASQENEYYTNYLNGTFSNSHLITHVEFCPGNPCQQLNGVIVFDLGLSCITTTESPQFSFQTTASNITAYSWTFYDQDGVTPLNQFPLTLSSEAMSYSQPGNYTVQLDVTYGDGCSATFYKYITVATECNGCTESNHLSAEVKSLYIDLINYLSVIYENNGTLSSNPYTCPQMQALAPYVTESNAMIWNPNYNITTGVLTFSFADHGTSHDVSVLLNGLVADINVMDFSSPENLVEYNTFYADGTVSNQQSIRHIDFCPQECTTVSGNINSEQIQSCTVIGSHAVFEFLPQVPGEYSYKWVIHNSFGQSTIPIPGVTFDYIFHNQGSYLIEVIITDLAGCVSTSYKSIIANSDCTSCTEQMGQSAVVKHYYKNLLNKLISGYQQGQNINNIDVSMELAVLIPYITDSSPGIYNVNYNNQVLSFSFSPTDIEPDVVINANGEIVDINIYNFSTPNLSHTGIVVFENGVQGSLYTRHINFCPEEVLPLPCESHVAFVIDESGSIDDIEANNIKTQLQNFIMQQEGSNLTVSLIGMSDSDQNLRTDHVTGKITAINQSNFTDWIFNYKSEYNLAKTGVSANSDYWASAVSYAYNLDPKPELIVVLTDGSQTSNLTQLKNLITTIKNNAESHLFVYGVGEGNYVDENNQQYNNNSTHEVTNTLMTSLKFLLDLPASEFPISGNEDLLNVVYYGEDNTFDFLYQEEHYFSNQLVFSGIGCGGSAVETCKVCETFQPSPGKAYWISGWIKEEQNIQVKNYTNGVIKVVYGNEINEAFETISLLPEGDIIDGWQRVAAKIVIPVNTTQLKIELENTSENIPVYFDDIRLHPINGSMKSFVYDPETFRLMAEHDDNNYSTFYEYDKEGGLIRIKKETSKGIKTIQESRSGNTIKLLPQN